MDIETEKVLSDFGVIYNVWSKFVSAMFVGQMPSNLYMIVSKYSKI